MREESNSNRVSAITDNSRPAATGWILGGIGVLVFSFSLPANKIAVGGLDPVAITAWRAALAGLLAAGYLSWRRPPLPARGDLVRLFVSGLGVVIGFPAFSSIALRTVDSSTCAVIVGLLPALTAVFAALVGGERLTPGFWLATGAGVAVLTVFLLTSSPMGPGGFALHWGYLFMFLATLSAAFGYALGGAQARRLGGAQSISWSLVLLLPVTIPVAAVTAVAGPASLTIAVLAAMTYLTIASQFLGFFAWYAGLARGGIARVGQVQQLQPLITMGWSALVLGERVSPMIVMVALTIATLIWLAQRSRFTGAVAPAGTLARWRRVRIAAPRSR